MPAMAENLSRTELDRIQAALGDLTLEGIEAELGRRSLYEFGQLAWPLVEPSAPFDPRAWHIGAICEHLQAVSEGQIKNLLINVPPGFGKSLWVSVLWPAWDWVRDPTLKLLTLAYAEELAIRDLVRTRRLIASEWYQARWPLAFTEDQNTKTNIENVRGGYRIVAGFDGSITGKRCRRKIIDDPHNLRDILSDKIRQNALYTYDEVLPTRIDDPRSASEVVIMQRGHEQDLAGHIIERGQHVLLCLPMRYERARSCVTALPWHEPRQAEGELLWPSRWGEPEVAALERQLGNPYAVAGQLQQRPAPRGGSMFDRAKAQIVLAAPADIRSVRFWDHAATVPRPGTDPDWRVGLRLGIGADGCVYILNVVRGRWAPDAGDKVLAATAAADGLDVRIVDEEQPGSAGAALAAAHLRLLHGYRFASVKPTGDKVVRAEPIAAQWDGGNVRIVQGAWNADFLDELCAFPAARHDDQVDALSGAYNWVAENLHSVTEAIIGIRQDRADDLGERRHGEWE